MNQQRSAELTEDRCGFGGPLRRVRGDPRVQRAAGPDGRVERAHGFLQRRVRVEPVAVEDVHVVQAHPAQRLVQAGQQVLTGAEVAVGSRPHVVAGLGGDDQLIAIRQQVLAHDPAEVDLRRAVRRPVVVGQVEVRDAEVERAPDDLPLCVQRPAVAEVLPETERHLRQLEPAAPAAPVGDSFVTISRGNISHAGKSVIEAAFPRAGRSLQP